MKSLVQFLNESHSFLINKHTSKVYNYHPQNRDELKKLINKLIKERGNKSDLNDIDTSAITNMYELFVDSNFNGDISKWDVSNVVDMRDMFYNSDFNGYISEWNVSKVENMSGMFYYSTFNHDISNWNVSNVKDMSNMFKGCPLQNKPPKWYKE